MVRTRKGTRLGTSSSLDEQMASTRRAGKAEEQREMDEQSASDHDEAPEEVSISTARTEFRQQVKERRRAAQSQQQTRKRKRSTQKQQQQQQTSESKTDESEEQREETPEHDRREETSEEEDDSEDDEQELPPNILEAAEKQFDNEQQAKQGSHQVFEEEDDHLGQTSQDKKHPKAKKKHGILVVAEGEGKEGDQAWQYLASQYSASAREFMAKHLYGDRLNRVPAGSRGQKKKLGPAQKFSRSKKTSRKIK